MLISIVKVRSLQSSNFDKRTGRLGNTRTSGGHPDYSIIKIGQNNEKNPKDLSRLVVTQALH